MMVYLSSDNSQAQVFGRRIQLITINLMTNQIEGSMARFVRFLSSCSSNNIRECRYRYGSTFFVKYQNSELLVIQNPPRRGFSLQSSGSGNQKRGYFITQKKNHEFKKTEDQNPFPDLLNVRTFEAMIKTRHGVVVLTSSN